MQPWRAEICACASGPSVTHAVAGSALLRARRACFGGGQTGSRSMAGRDLQRAEARLLRRCARAVRARWPRTDRVLRAPAARVASEDPRETVRPLERVVSRARPCLAAR